MKLVWTKSKLPLSIFIRFITGEDCSHFAFVFESKAAGLMFESNLLGCHPAFFESSLKTHTIVHQLNIDVPVEVEDNIWDLIVEKYDGKGYDFLGAIYLGWYKFLHRFFGVKIPLVNKWSQPDQYYCDEIYEVLNSLPGFPTVNAKGGMATPHDIYMNLKERVK